MEPSGETWIMPGPVGPAVAVARHTEPPVMATTHGATVCHSEDVTRSHTSHGATCHSEDVTRSHGLS